MMKDFYLKMITGNEPPFENKGPCELCEEQHKIWMAEAIDLCRLISGGEEPDLDRVDVMVFLRECIKELMAERDQWKVSAESHYDNERRLRIQHLNFEKDRLQRRHKQSAATVIGMKKTIDKSDR